MKPLPNDPVILAAFRSPIGKYGGVLASVRPDDLLALVMREAINKASVNEGDIDHIVIGCANQAGEDNRNIARMALLLAGLSHDVPGITLNRLCASGLDAIIDASRRIITKEADLLLAGGIESMSRAPFVMAKSPTGFRLGPPEVFDSSLGWRFFNERMRECTPPEPNGVTAERLSEIYKINKTRQDQFALLSHQNAIKAQREGSFAKELIPIPVQLSKNKTGLVEKDEGPRADTSIEKLAMLSSVFKENGTVTAGNSSSLNDGAAILVMSSFDYAMKNKLSPKARVIGFASAGVDPKVMGLGPVPATQKLLRNYDLAIDDFDVIEINEAFAVQVLSVIDQLKIKEHKINPLGGAIALGHPLGCSGARIVCTMLNSMQQKRHTLGLATLCVGVGQGVSMAIEAI